MHERTASPLMITVHAPHWPEPAAEARALQIEIVAQHVQERRRGIDVHGARRAVDAKGEFRHARPV